MPGGVSFAPFDLVRWGVPATLLVASAPPFFAITVAIDAVTAYWAWDRRVIEAIHDYLWGSYQKFALFVFEQCAGTKLYLHGETVNILLGKPEDVIYVSNHQSAADWIVTDMLAVRQPGQEGRLRYVLKDTLKWMPLYGWYFFHHGCVYVKRSKMKFSESRMVFYLEALRRRHKMGWLVLYPEGTRFDPTHTPLISRSRALAAERGLPQLRHLLTPRHRALQCCLETLRGGGRVQTLYDVTILYGSTRNNDAGTGRRKPAPSLAELVTKRGQEIHVHIRPLKMAAHAAAVPNEGIDVWLHKVFLEKDRLLSRYYDDGESASAIFGPPVSWPLPISRTLPHAMFWPGLALAMLCWPYPHARSCYLALWVAGSVYGAAYVWWKQAA